MSVQPNIVDRVFDGEKILLRQTEVECRLNTAEEIKNIIAVNGSASAITEEVLDGEVRFSGRAVFCIVYQNEDGEFCRTECGVEFSDKIDGCNDGDVKYINYYVSGEDVRQVNGGYTVSATVTARIVCSCPNRVKLVVGGENLLCDEVTKTVCVKADESRAFLQLDEELEWGYGVKEILSHTEYLSVNDVQSGIGCINIEGNIILSLTMLQKNEKNVIVKENKVIPFKLELEVKGASPNMQAYVFASMSKSSLKVVVDEENNSSTCICSFDLDAYGAVYVEQEMPFIRDAYSTQNRISIVKGQVDHFYPKQFYKRSERVFGASDCIADDDAELVCSTFERVESVSINEDTNTLVGVISACLIFKRGDGGVFGTRSRMPFELPFNRESEIDYKINVCIESFACRVRASVDFEATLKICVTEYSKANFEILTDVVVGEEKTEKTNAISVYVPLPDSSLWDVCKQVGVGAEKLMELNPELEFPLSGDERIIVYRSI